MTDEPFPWGYQVLRRAADYFRPRTPAAAHQALRTGLLPPELFVARINDLRPLIEEPYDLDEIDRILARRRLDHTTARLLVEIFETLAKNSDPEVALFAAEGLNLLEVRYERAVRSAQDPRARLKALMRLADLHRSRPVLRRFYLEEAWQGWRRAPAPLRLSDTLRLASLHRELGRADRAEALLEAAWRAHPGHPRLALARADLAFRRGDGPGVRAALAAVPPERRTPALRVRARFWGVV